MSCWFTLLKSYANSFAKKFWVKNSQTKISGVKSRGSAIIGALAVTTIGSIIALGSSFLVVDQAETVDQERAQFDQGQLQPKIARFLKNSFNDNQCGKRLQATLEKEGKLDDFKAGKTVTLNFLRKGISDDLEDDIFPPELNCFSDYDDCEGTGATNRDIVLRNRQTYGLEKINFFQIQCAENNCGCSSYPCSKKWRLNLNTAGSQELSQAIGSVLSLPFLISRETADSELRCGSLDRPPLSCSGGLRVYEASCSSGSLRPTNCNPKVVDSGNSNKCIKCSTNVASHFTPARYDQILVDDNNDGLFDRCQECPQGQKPNTNHTACIPCPAGTAKPSDSKVCMVCPAGTYSGAGAIRCTACPYGTYNDQTKQAGCRPLGNDKYTFKFKTDGSDEKLFQDMDNDDKEKKIKEIVFKEEPLQIMYSVLKQPEDPSDPNSNPEILSDEEKSAIDQIEAHELAPQIGSMSDPSDEEMKDSGLASYTCMAHEKVSPNDNGCVCDPNSCGARKRIKPSTKAQNPNSNTDPNLMFSNIDVPSLPAGNGCECECLPQFPKSPATCPSNQNLVNNINGCGGRCELKTCGPGQFLGASSCEPCPAGTYNSNSNHSNFSCSPCGANQYQNGTGKISCKSCGLGKRPNSNKTGCVCTNPSPTNCEAQGKILVGVDVNGCGGRCELERCGPNRHRSCSGDNQELVNIASNGCGECRISTPTCLDGQTLRNGSCVCSSHTSPTSCPANTGKVLRDSRNGCNGVCRCPSGKVENLYGICEEEKTSCRRGYVLNRHLNKCVHYCEGLIGNQEDCGGPKNPLGQCCLGFAEPMQEDGPNNGGFLSSSLSGTCEVKCTPAKITEEIQDLIGTRPPTAPTQECPPGLIRERENCQANDRDALIWYSVPGTICGGYCVDESR